MSRIPFAWDACPRSGAGFFGEIRQWRRRDAGFSLAATYSCADTRDA
jgi:hypothetical protein